MHGDGGARGRVEDEDLVARGPLALFGEREPGRDVARAEDAGRGRDLDLPGGALACVLAVAVGEAGVVVPEHAQAEVLADGRGLVEVAPGGLRRGAFAGGAFAGGAFAGGAAGEAEGVLGVAEPPLRGDGAEPEPVRRRVLGGLRVVLAVARRRWPLARR